MTIKELMTGCCDIYWANFRIWLTKDEYYDLETNVKELKNGKKYSDRDDFNLNDILDFQIGDLVEVYLHVDYDEERGDCPRLCIEIERHILEEKYPKVYAKFRDGIDKAAREKYTECKQKQSYYNQKFTGEEIGLLCSSAILLIVLIAILLNKTFIPVIVDETSNIEVIFLGCLIAFLLLFINYFKKEHKELREEYNNRVSDFDKELKSMGIRI